MHFGITSLIGRSTPPRKLPKSVSPDRAGILAASADPVDLPERDLDEEIRQLMLRYGQRFDIQTRLMNQQTFQAALAELLRNCPADQEIALIWIDVLNLRREFALSGSRGVEALVVHIADSLRSAVDSDALLGRFGARAFLVAMPASKLDRGACSEPRSGQPSQPAWPFTRPMPIPMKSWCVSRASRPPAPAAPETRVS